jgi:hypothetical protein
MRYLAGFVPRNLQDDAQEGIIHTENLYYWLLPLRLYRRHTLD